MGKLPKSMRQKQDNVKNLRRQGSPNSSGASLGGKGMNRQARRRMQQQGLEGMENIEATRVIIQTEEGDLVIEDPQVIKVNQQGMEIYQVIGSAETKEKGSYAEELDEASDDGVNQEDDQIEESIEDFSVEITDQDIQLVAMQTGVSPETAENALKETNGDLARAIMNLKSR